MVLCIFISCGVKRWISHERAFLVDVHTPQEYAEGTADNAINIPLSQIEERLHEFPEHSKIVVFCRTGNRSKQAFHKLQNAGFIHVKNGGS